MSPPIFLPSTPRLEEILDKVRDAIALEEPSLLVKNGEDVVYRYPWPSELIVKVRDEIDNRVCTKVAGMMLPTNEFSETTSKLR